MRRRGQIAYPATKRRGVHHLTVVYVFFLLFFRVVVRAARAKVAAPRAKVAAPVPAAPATVVLCNEREGRVAVDCRGVCAGQGYCYWQGLSIVA